MYLEDKKIYSRGFDQANDTPPLLQFISFQSSLFHVILTAGEQDVRNEPDRFISIVSYDSIYIYIV